jgi:AAA15 family ATPase/GTPase
MLLRFSVSNFGSIRDKQELSMIASHAIKDNEGALIETPELQAETVLPAAVIYGANASGKSTLVRALWHMQNLVRDSHRKGEPSGGVQLNPFLLDSGYAEMPSTFSLDFILNGVRYAYSLTATRLEFTNESLFSWSNNRRTRLFERNNGCFKFGRDLKGTNKTISKLTRTNSLFLSAAAQNNHDQLQKISSFMTGFFIDIGVTTDDQMLNVIVSNIVKAGMSEFDDTTIKLLALADTGICASRITDLGEQPNRQAIIEKIDSLLDEMAHNEEVGTLKLASYPRKHKIELAHKVGESGQIFLDVSNESSGTIEILTMSPFIFLALHQGKPLILDEFGSRLHTRAAEMILSLFNNKETNPKGGQLIVATHDTNLLNAKGLRRDQVWFTEKDQGGATHLYPLTDITTRPGDNLEKGYLQGRYGAIPFAGPLADLVKAS